MNHVSQSAEKPTERDPSPDSFLVDFKAALLNRPHRGIYLKKTKHTLSAQVRYLAVPWNVGAVLMSAATWVMVGLEVFNRPGTAIAVYLLIVTLLLLMDSFLRLRSSRSLRSGASIIFRCAVLFVRGVKHPGHSRDRRLPA